MNSVIIDTHEAVKNLKDSGIEEKQAEAVVKLVSNVMTDKLATKKT